MAEAIATLAFAGNIVQFLEFGAKFVNRAHQIAKAGSNNLSDLEELRHITHHLDPLLQDLSVEGPSDELSPKSTSQQRLIKLSHECSQVVRELLEALKKAGINDSRRRMDAIVTSFRLTWHHAEIAKLRRRIDDLRDQLAVELLISVREHSVKSLQTQKDILQQLKVEPRRNPTHSEEDGEQGPVQSRATAPGVVILEYLRSILDPNTAREQMTRTEDAIHQLLFQQGAYVDYGGIFGQDHPKIEMESSRRQTIEARIISSLRYTHFADREAMIADAYEKTLQWMFEGNSRNRKDTTFRQWLESSDPLYWITGKAGSGKSTLMKYVSNFDGKSEGSSKCRKHLQMWAGGKDCLVVASFYFWAGGSAVEASQQGLFQSLLFQILKAHPDLLPRVAPRTWEAWSSFGLEINMAVDQSLDKILYIAIQELVTQRNKKVCLFVDGLDEYHGDHQKLITTFHSILLLPNVKICVSSRPWVIFEDSFSTVPSLMLHEFTYPDIEHFVSSQFSQNDGFKRLQLCEPEYAETLIENITVKASGVFLWIRIVVKSLLAGLAYDDRISDLQRRLNLLPPELEKLYDAILEDLDPFYFGHASQYFQLLEASNDNPDALLYSFVDEESLEFALKLPIQAFTEEEKRMRSDSVRRRLNSRCKGMLEVGLHGKVQYLHRSVKEYINEIGVRQKLERAVGMDFDRDLQLCSANLAMVKIMGECYEYERISYAKECLLAAAKVKQNIPKMIQILDDLDRTTRETLSVLSLREFYRTEPDEFDVHPWYKYYHGTSFLATTVRLSVLEYVRARTQSDCLASDDCHDHDDAETYPEVPKLDLKSSRFRRLMQKSRLLTITEPRKITARRKGTWPLLLDANACNPISLPMYRCLLELGADPNMVCDRDGTSPWTQALTAMILSVHLNLGSSDASQYQRWEQWLPILELFLKHGARRDESVYELAVRRAMSRGDGMYMMGSLSTNDLISDALECVASGRGDSAFLYLLGKPGII